MALAAKAEHERVYGACTRQYGCSGQPRTMITQALMKNTAVKEHRQHDWVDETRYESVAHNNQLVGTNTANDSNGA